MRMGIYVLVRVGEGWSWRSLLGWAKDEGEERREEVEKVLVMVHLSGVVQE